MQACMACMQGPLGRGAAAAMRLAWVAAYAPPLRRPTFIALLFSLRSARSWSASDFIFTYWSYSSTTLWGSALLIRFLQFIATTSTFSLMNLKSRFARYRGPSAAAWLLLEAAGALLVETSGEAVAVAHTVLLLRGWQGGWNGRHLNAARRWPPARSCEAVGRIAPAANVPGVNGLSSSAGHA